MIPCISSPKQTHSNSGSKFIRPSSTSSFPCKPDYPFDLAPSKPPPTCSSGQWTLEWTPLHQRGPHGHGMLCGLWNGLTLGLVHVTLPYENQNLSTAWGLNSWVSPKCWALMLMLSISSLQESANKVISESVKHHSHIDWIISTRKTTPPSQYQMIYCKSFFLAVLTIKFISKNYNGARQCHGQYLWYLY